jgi:predicted RNA-binding protein YlqC (UPF0109 family)
VVEIVIKGDPSTFTNDQKSKLLKMLALNLDCSHDVFNILSVRSGSIILQVEMPVEVAERLIELFEDGDPIVDDLGIGQIKIISEQNAQVDDLTNLARSHSKSIQTTVESSWGSSSIRDLIEYMAKAIANDPDSVIVREIEGPSATIFEITVTPDDIGRIIGKEGRVANAMRTLLRVAAARLGKHFSLEVGSESGDS